MKANDHGLLCSCFGLRRPEVEDETILTHATRLHVVENEIRVRTASIGWNLRRDVTVVERIADSSPLLHGLRTQESIGARSRCSVRKSLEDRNATRDEPAHFAVGGFDNRKQIGFACPPAREPSRCRDRSSAHQKMTSVHSGPR